MADYILQGRNSYIKVIPNILPSITPISVRMPSMASSNTPFRPGSYQLISFLTSMSRDANTIASLPWKLMTLTMTSVLPCRSNLTPKF